MKKALIYYGGWDGHHPKEIAGIFEEMLKKEDFSVEVYDTLDCLDKDLCYLDLIVPIWTMAEEIKDEYVNNMIKAVEGGTGIAGCHGGMADAFRKNVNWQFLTGAQWVAHPKNIITYEVNLLDNMFTKDLEDFTVTSEQYYMHYDPAVKIHATTTFAQEDMPYYANGEVVMPVVFTKMWGAGKVFYNSLGHTPDIFDIPQAYEIMRRGFVWAAR